MTLEEKVINFRNRLVGRINQLEKHENTHKAEMNMNAAVVCSVKRRTLEVVLENIEDILK